MHVVQGHRISYLQDPIVEAVSPAKRLSDRYVVDVGGERYTCRLFNPWPTVLNPIYEESLDDLCNHHWARSHGLEYAPLEKFRPAMFAAYTLPTASRDGLVIAGRFDSFLFAHDDLFVDRPDADVEVLRALINEYRVVLREEPDPRWCRSPLARMLADIVASLKQFRINLEPWKRALVDYLMANVREVESPRDELPTVERYLQERPLAGAVYPVLELAYIVRGIVIPSWLRANPFFSQLANVAALHICMNNDFISLPKEVKAGDGQNIVAIYREHMALDSYQAAADRVLEEHLFPLVDAFVSNSKELRQLVEVKSPQALWHYDGAVEVMRNWMCGYLQWEANASRHRVIAEKTPLMAVSGAR